MRSSAASTLMGGPQWVPVDQPAPSQAAGRETPDPDGIGGTHAELAARATRRNTYRADQVRLTFGGVEITGLAPPHVRVDSLPDSVQSLAAVAGSFAAWAQSLARWTPPPPKPSTIYDAARRWLARRRASWLASEERRIAAIRDAERTSRLRRAGREAAEVNRALAEGRLGLVAGGLPMDD